MPQPYARIARKILPHWELSLAFVTPRAAAALNRRLRGKSYTPNVLSYVVGKRHGEIIICKSVAYQQAASFELSKRDFLAFLFIHALLHLKGGRHGTTMERREHTLLKKFQSKTRILTYGSTHRNRHRHRHLTNKGGRRRRDPR